ILLDLGDRTANASALELLASIRCTLGKKGHAALIWGAAQRQREILGTPKPPDEVAQYEEQIASARAGFGDDPAFDKLWSEGYGMTLEEAIRFVLVTCD